MKILSGRLIELAALFANQMNAENYSFSPKLVRLIALHKLTTKPLVR